MAVLGEWVGVERVATRHIFVRVVWAREAGLDNHSKICVNYMGILRSGKIEDTC